MPADLAIPVNIKINNMNKFIIIVIAIVLASCGTSRKAQKPTPVASAEIPLPVDKAEPVSSVLAKLNHIDYNTFQGKMDVDYSNNGDKKSFDLKIQMTRDEKIWLSVIGPLNIEVARGIITKDSVKLINKFEKTYLEGSIAYLQEKIGLPLDLHILQDIIVGNPVFIDNNNSSYTVQNNAIVIDSKTKYFTNLLTVLLPGYLIADSKLQDVDSSKQRSAALVYKEYKNTGTFSFPTSRNIQVQYKKNISITFNYKSFGFNEPVTMPFSVPDSYKKSVIK